MQSKPRQKKKSLSAYEEHLARVGNAPREEISAPYDELDPLIRETVRILAENGIETCQSCQGGKGHSYPEPTVEFFGGYESGFRAYAIAVAHGLCVSALRRQWSVQSGELVGPIWSMTFAKAPTSAWG